MKVLIVSEMSVPYVVGGGEVRYGLLARELVRRGHSVTWLSMRQRDSPGEEVIDAVRHLHRGPRIESPPARPLLSMIRFMFSAFLHVLTNRYDVIDVQTYAPLSPVWLACLLSRQRMVATIHDVSRAQNGQWMTDRFGGLITVAESLLYRIPYPRIIAVSKSTADALVARWGVDRRKIAVIPNGIRLPPPQIAGTRPQHIDLIFAGRFVPTKNIEDLIETVRICHRAGMVQRAVLVGDGPLLEAMAARVQSAGLAAVVELPGRKGNAEVLELLGQSKIFLHASSREGFPVVMIEALACGLPVVAYEVPGVVDVIENGTTGLLVRERDVASHARACMDLLASDKRRKAMGTAGRAFATAALTIDRMTDSVLEAYRDTDDRAWRMA